MCCVTLHVLLHSTHHGEVPLQMASGFLPRALEGASEAWGGRGVSVCHGASVREGSWDFVAQRAFLSDAMAVVDGAPCADWILALDARASPAVSEGELAGILTEAASLVQGRTCDLLLLGHVLRGRSRSVTPNASFLELQAGARSEVGHAFLISAACVRSLSQEWCAWLERAEFVLASRQQCFLPPQDYSAGWVWGPVQALLGWGVTTKLASAVSAGFR